MGMARPALEDRVAAVCEQLELAERQLDLPLIRDLLEPQAATRLSGKLGDRRKSVKRALSTATEDAGWDLFATEEKAARQLMAELFALVQGRLFSSAGLDNGIAGAARRLLQDVQELSGLDRGVLVTFSPDTESVDHTIGLVRLRFPGTTVWDLPFAVHEFGHHAVHELAHIDAAHSDDRPLRSLVTGPFGTKAGLDESHVHELIADVFATVALGATYPIACIQRRINAKQRATDGTTHPSWQRRVTTMVAALDHMTKLSDDKRYAATAAQLVLPAWQALTGQAAPPDAPELKALAHKAVDVLARHAPKLTYDDKESAVLVKYELTTAAQPGPPRPVEVPPNAGPAAIVDAAWRWRRQNPDATPVQRSRVDKHAIALCTAVPTDRGN
ncbi:hypothetical protein EV645_5147 [Kribbella rubisoli]|uniref:Uncharacterized protein n=2 Tax=Kribbella rubisoli TaxID=3075929 RepID=A0A4V2FXN3_9ACTN|nr:hypothetical protein EV645_5147 [Kribbella rubisoli]